MNPKKKVLIAEDSSVILNLTRKVLEFSDYSISFAKNGQQVIDLLSKEPFDLLIVDIAMPVMDGMECVTKIREGEQGGDKRLPVIAISGNARNLTEVQYLAAGFDAYLGKPLDYDQLLKTVNQILTAN